MKKHWKLTVSLIAGCLVAAYLAGPIIAGYLQVGHRLGPRIYPEGLHDRLFVITHKFVHGTKPRMSLDVLLYDRPWFYDQERRPKSQQERLAVLERLRQNKSLVLDVLIKLNEKMEAWRLTG